MILPGGAHAKIGGPKAARIAVDVEANRIEAAHADELAAGRLDAKPMCFIPSVITRDCLFKRFSLEFYSVAVRRCGTPTLE